MTVRNCTDRRYAGYFMLFLAALDALMTASAVSTGAAFVAGACGFATGWCALSGLDFLMTS